MKKRALAIALSLALLLSVFVPGTLATSSTETETDTTTVVSQPDTEVLAADGEGTLSGDGQSVVTDGDTVTGDGQTTDEDSVTGDGQTAGEGTVTGDGQTAGEGTVTGDGQTTEEGTVTDDGQTAGEGTVTDDGQTAGEGMVTDDGQTVDEGNVTGDGQTVDEGNVTGDGQTADPTEATAATEPTVATDPTETTAATDPTDPVCTCPGTEEEKAAEGFVHQEGCPHYVETAPAMPQLMMMIAADIRAGGSETIDSKWFVFSGVEQTPSDFPGVEEGEITTDKVPDIDGYTFVGAYVEDIPVVQIGQIVFEGKTYVYYTTKGSSDVAAMVLDEDDGDTIELRYSLDAVSITYSVTVGGETVGGYGYTVKGVPYGGSTTQPIQVVPSTNPTEVFPGPGNGYSFTVEIPRGYQATVYVNGMEQDQKLGAFPSFTGDHRIITMIGELPKYQENYEVDNVTSAQNIRVELTKADPVFSADLISRTEYFSGRATHRVDNQTATNGKIGDDHSVTWVVTTNADYWLMNKLAINKTKITVPFSDTTETTILSTGTVVKVERETDRSGIKTYTITCTNCYENLVVTDGNLNNAEGWPEYMPYAYVGVIDVEYYNGDASQWRDLIIGNPVAAKPSQGGENHENIETSGSWPNSNKYYASFRFKLLPGYEDPILTINGKEISAELQSNGYYTTERTLVYTYNRRGSDLHGFGDYPRLIEIKAKEANVRVKYEKGIVTGADPIPTDENTYNLSGVREVRIPTTIPMDTSKKMVFQGWKNGKNTYSPNAVIDLANLTIENGTVTFTAQWIDASKAEQIQFTIQIVDESDNVLGSFSSNAPNGVPIILDVNSDTIQTWFDKHPWYEISDNNELYHESISNGEVVNLIVKERTATITYTVIGPEGAGTVTPSYETVMVKTTEHTIGSIPTPNPGYRFVGWYTDEACTQEVNTDWVNPTNNELKPRKPGDLWEDATYYAKFEPAVASLTITASRIEGTYDAQGTIYQVEVDAADGESDVTFYVSIDGNSYVTIENLPYGNYKVTPMNDWSWRYGVLNPQIDTPEVQGDGTMAASVTFDYGIQNYKWLSGNDYFECK